MKRIKAVALISILMIRALALCLYGKASSKVFVEDYIDNTGRNVDSYIATTIAEGFALGGTKIL